MEKNQGGKWCVFAFGDEGHANPGEPITGDAANITANVRIDGGAANAVDDTNPAELEDGYYVFDVTAAESNGDMLLLCPQSATANVNVIAVPGAIYTRPANFNALGIAADGDLTKVNTLDGHTAQTADHTAGIADIPTVAEFEARTILAAAYFDPAADTVANVTLVDAVTLTTTVTTLTGHTAQTGDSFARLGAPSGLSVSVDIAAMQTDVTNILLDTSTTIPNLLGVMTTKINDIPTVAEFELRTILAASYFDPATDPVATVTTLTGHTPQTADHTAGIADIPTVAEFNARTLAAAAYFDPATDPVATLAGHTPQTGDSFARLGAPAGLSVSADIADIPTVAELNARTLAAAAYFDPAADTVATLAGHTPQTGDSFARLGAPSGGSVSADIADIPTVAEFNARTIASAAYFDPAVDVVANVTLVDTVTTATTVTTVATLTGHTAQTGDSFARIGAPVGASISADIAAISTGVGPTVSEFNARTIPSADYFDPATDTVVNVTNVAVLTGHTPQTADHTAGIADVPTVAEFNARTILAAAYFDPATDAVANVTNVATLTGHTAQTGDSFARLGAPAGLSVSVDIAAIHTVALDVPTNAEFNARTLVAASYFDPAADAVATVTSLTGHTPQTGDSFARIGAAGASLTLVPWNPAWDTEVESECNDALVAIHLDHMFAVEVADEIVDNSYAAKMASSSGDWSTFVWATDANQAIRDRGDASWITGGGGAYPAIMQSTTIATLASQTSFTLTAGSADDNAYNGALAVVTDSVTGVQKAKFTIATYTGSTKTVALTTDPGIFTMAVGDSISIIATVGTSGGSATLENQRVIMDVVQSRVG